MSSYFLYPFDKHSYFYAKFRNLHSFCSNESFVWNPWSWYIKEWNENHEWNIRNSGAVILFFATAPLGLLHHFCYNVHCQCNVLNSFQFCTGMNFAVLGLVYVASWHNDTCGPVKYCKIQTNYFHHKTNFYLAQRHVLQLKFNGHDEGMETEYNNYLLSIFF